MRTRTCSILRDLSRTSTAEPFGLRALPAEAAVAPPEVLVEVEDLTKDDMRSIARDPSVRAIAPVMPISLVHPFEVDESAAGAKPWGISAVGADVTARTGAGVVVCVLDTGIDSAHPAFSGLSLVEHDFSGSGPGDRQGHGPTARAQFSAATSPVRGSVSPPACRRHSSARCSATTGAATPTCCSGAFSGRCSRAPR